MIGDEEPIRLERLLAAPIDEVFDAMTNPARMAQWFSPVGRAEVEANAVVGGRLRVVMIDEEIRLEHEGEFLEVRRPTRLVFTWRSRFTDDQPTVVTVELPRRGREDAARPGARPVASGGAGLARGRVDRDPGPALGRGRDLA